jgi:Icc-related predicted phosphoesterase
MASMESCLGNFNTNAAEKIKEPKMKFIATGDFGGNVKIVERLLSVNYKKYSFIVFTGDFIAMKELRKIGEATARGFKVDMKINYLDIKNRLRRINEVFKELSIRTKVYGILGNSDLKKTFISLVPKLEFKNLHNCNIKVEDYFLVGYEGRPKNIDELERPNETEKAGIFPGRTFDERAEECNAWDEEKAYDDLSKILRTLNPKKCILVTHSPPYGILDKVKKENIPWAMASYGDSAKSGNIGSQAFLRISKEFGILLHVFSHVHESKGVEEIGNTTYVNIGSLEEENELWEIELKNGEVEAYPLKLSKHRL